ncbi:flavodoxin [Paenibacillus farraposensis]|uniref:Flavodoxin n=1 Tax=Paenibacillus farraposensis TaxID=2807095 RepID=A0ABW4DD57_9BACL|nr:flavodoxin [Paenibacillus farraposensis]MCC3381001.1 flavodoxin [Paenibacillus farraposensis]
MNLGKILIAYASLTGNTEEIAELIAEGVRQAGHEAELKASYDCNAADLLEYDGFLLGVYTWGDGELPDEFLDFYEELDELDLSGKKTAVFGSGDTSYEQFCGAVDLVEEKVKERGAFVIQESLKIEFSPMEDEKENCRAYGRQFAQAGIGVS